jgi:hypothetical protein
MKFQLTFETYTKESMENGDCSASGWVCPAGCTSQLSPSEPNDLSWDLREVADRFRGYEIQPSSSTVNQRSWLIIDSSQDDFLSPYGFWSGLPTESKEEEIISASIGVHRPDGITDASWLRVQRLLLGRPIYQPSTVPALAR